MDKNIGYRDFSYSFHVDKPCIEGQVTLLQNFIIAEKNFVRRIIGVIITRIIDDMCGTKEEFLMDYKKTHSIFMIIIRLVNEPYVKYLLSINVINQTDLRDIILECKEYGITQCNFTGERNLYLSCNGYYDQLNK